MRKCVGYMESKPKSELIRIIAYEGKINIDVTGRANGRGAYICPEAECLAKAEKNNGLKRSLKTDIDKETLAQLFEDLKTY